MALKTYPNGLRLSIIKKEKTPLLTVTMYITSGTQSEKNYESGISSFTSKMLLMGIKFHPYYSELMSYAKSNGVVLSSDSTAESITVSAKTTYDNWEKAVEILYSIAFESMFLEESATKVRASMLSDVNKLELNPADVLEKMVNQALFYRTGLANPKFGTNTTLSRMTAEDSKEYFERVFTPKNTIISVVGDVDADAVYEKIMKTFYTKFNEGGDYKKLKFVAPIDDFVGGNRSKNKKLNQSRVFLAFPAISFRNSKKYALDICLPIIESVIRRNMSSMPFFHSEQLQNVSYANNGKFIIECLVDHDAVETYLDKLIETIKEIVELGISDNQFELEKNAYIVKYLESTENSANLSYFAAREVAINKQSYSQASELMKIELLKASDANEVVREVFDFTKLYVAYLGNPIEIDYMKYVD